MPNPTFSKTGVTTFTFEKARFLPVKEPRVQNTKRTVAGGGQVKVAKHGERVRFFDIIINRVSSSNRDDLITFLEDTNIDYDLNTFTFTDEDSNTYTVRYWDSKGLDVPQVKGGLYNIRLRLRAEVL